MRLPVLLLACAAVLAAPGALAQPQPTKKAPAKTDPRTAEAKKLFDDGAAAYAAGNYEEAIKNWEKAYELSQKPLIYDNLANAWERLGDTRKTRECLAKWREAAPPEERDGLDARIRNLDARIARDEEAAARAAAAQAAREARQRAEAEAAQRKPWLAGAIVASVGGAAVISGVVVDVVASTKRPGSSACKTSAGQTLCLTSAQDAITTSNRMAVAGDITWGVGAALVASGVVVVIVRRPRPLKDVGPSDTAPLPPRPPSAYLAPLPGGMMLGGSF
jgi:hypothetical protein